MVPKDKSSSLSEPIDFDILLMRQKKKKDRQTFARAKFGLRDI